MAAPPRLPPMLLTASRKSTRKRHHRFRAVHRSSSQNVAHRLTEGMITFDLGNQTLVAAAIDGSTRECGDQRLEAPWSISPLRYCCRASVQDRSSASATVRGRFVGMPGERLHTPAAPHGVKILHFLAAKGPYQRPAVVQKLDDSRLFKLDKGLANGSGADPKAGSQFLVTRWVPAANSPWIIAFNRLCTT